jgi:hypothetical protein
MDGKSMDGNLMDEKSMVGISGSLNMQPIYRILLTIASTLVNTVVTAAVPALLPALAVAWPPRGSR